MSEKSCIVIPKQMQVHSLLMLQTNPDPPEPPQTMDQDQPKSSPAWPPYPGFKLQPIPTFPRDPSLPEYKRNPSLPNLPSNFLPMHNWLKNPMGASYLDLRQPRTIHTAPIIFPHPDTSRPAPPLPPGYGTKQYPACSDVLRAGNAAEQEMKLISLSIKKEERDQIYDHKMPIPRKLLKTSCTVCGDYS